MQHSRRISVQRGHLHALLAGRPHELVAQPRDESVPVFDVIHGISGGAGTASGCSRESICYSSCQSPASGVACRKRPQPHRQHTRDCARPNRPDSRAVTTAGSSVRTRFCPGIVARRSACSLGRDRSSAWTPFIYTMYTQVFQWVAFVYRSARQSGAQEHRPSGRRASSHVAGTLDDDLRNLLGSPPAGVRVRSSD